MMDRRSFDAPELQISSEQQNKGSDDAERKITEHDRQHPGEGPRIVRIVFRSGPPHDHSRDESGKCRQVPAHQRNLERLAAIGAYQVIGISENFA